MAMEVEKKERMGSKDYYLMEKLQHEHKMTKSDLIEMGDTHTDTQHFALLLRSESESV